MSLFTSCHSNTSLAQPATSTPTLSEETQLNISYGPDSLQRMDVYLPAGRSAATTASLVLIHGGGWNSGSKSDFASYIDSFRHRLPDYAIFNLDYRLVSNQHLFPTQEQDVKAALDFISAQSAAFGINKHRVALLGASAGAHLALLQAYKYSEPRVKAVIDFFGPTDLTEMYQRPWHHMIPYLLQTLTGTTPAAQAEVYRQSSPAHFVTAGSAPTLILHGSSDPIVSLSQSQLLQKRLQKAGVPHELVVYPNERHGWRGATLHHSFDRIEGFLKTHLP
ncbi:alpha/beta hydrolase [Paraflavisolibacter sp. H34]|uniref:alpha/beta hydrolase n=1 Tax=Huijunlia imazamoxiresistens TaxID=3127457 RepID=UPI003017C5D8